MKWLRRIGLTVLEYLLAVRWGGMTLVSLFISVLSGLVIALQYSPTEPFYSTSTMELVVPFGSFWRGLHYYASQAFFLLLIGHFVVITGQNQHGYARLAWVRLTLSLPVAILLLFTGYVLRSDATGEAAGVIAEHIIRSLPGIGTPLNGVLFDLEASGMKRVYANHLIGLVMAGLWCTWPHLRRYTTHWRDHAGLIVFLLLLSVFVAVPMETERFGMLHINGPWFFLGLQELLRYFPPLFAGVVYPGVILACVLLLPQEGRTRNRILWGIWLWLVVYAGLSLVGYLRG